MPQVAGYDMAGQFCPADQTGGDTFDLVPLDEHRLFVLLGDASGHGIGPALSATQMTGMLRVALRLGADLNAIFAQVNNQLVEDLPEEHFVTAFFGVLDTRSHSVNYHAAGQGPLLHFCAATGECRWLSPTTFPMGFMQYPHIESPQCIELAPGDILGLISDGVFEAENATGEMFGTGGVEQVLRAGQRGSMSDLMAKVLQAVHVHASGRAQADDMTLPPCSNTSRAVSMRSTACSGSSAISSPRARWTRNCTRRCASSSRNCSPTWSSTTRTASTTFH
jgi:phosphoserine phosphatase